MRRNAVQRLIVEDQIDGNTMEARIARIESDVSHIRSDVANLQLDVRDLRNEMKAANDSITEIKSGLAEARVGIATVGARIDAKVNALESRLIKWIVGTVLASAGLAFSIAKFVH